MSMLPVIIAPDQRLLMRSAEVASVNGEVQKLLDNMLETMYIAGGIGLAAVQVGVHKRVLVTYIPPSEESEIRLTPGFYSEGGPYCIINPQIIDLSENKVLMPEGCLSLPSQRDYVLRPEAIIINYLDYNGAEKVLKANGWLARCLQHEMDHLNGRLFIEHLSKLKYDLAINKAIKIKKRNILPDWAETQ